MCSRTPITYSGEISDFTCYLCSPASAIYRQVHRAYDTTNHLGKYSESESRQVAALHKVHGNNWKEIALLVGRSQDSVRDHFRVSISNLSYVCTFIHPLTFFSVFIMLEFTRLSLMLTISTFCPNKQTVLKKDCGMWSEEEVMKLKTAVSNVSDGCDLDNSSGTPWKTVATLMGSRSASQCMTKWSVLSPVVMFSRQ